MLAGGFVGAQSAQHMTSMVLYALAVILSGCTFAPQALRSLRHGQLGVAILMTVAVVGALILGQIAESAVLGFVFATALVLKARAMARARHGLRVLLDVLPSTARIGYIGGEVDIPVDNVRMFDVLVVRPGERIATDGIVVSGRSTVDASAVTGESTLLRVEPGDPVPAGALNGAGPLHLEATADGRDNSLTAIVRLAERAHTRKGTRSRLADRIARALVPAILIGAALVAALGSLFGDPTAWIERALVVLVAASPGALAIAVPVTVISGIAAASRSGMVIRSGCAFERLAAIRTVAFDKTGALTRNRPRVVEVRSVDCVTRSQLLAWAAGVETRSFHPLAAALIAAAPNAPAATELIEHPGQGVSGTLAGRRVQVGSTRWLDPGALTAALHEMANQGMTTVVVHVDGLLAGIIGIRDELRPEARDAVAQLHKADLLTVVLSGDDARTAQALATQVGITSVRAECPPQDKARAVAALGPCTAMAGHGINDPAALAAAEVGIAIGAGGSALAVQSADLAITGTDLRVLPRALTHVRRGRMIMTQNVIVAFAVIGALFPLALLGMPGLVGTVLIQETAELVVIFNGMRAARLPPTTIPTAEPRMRRMAAPTSLR